MIPPTQGCVARGGGEGGGGWCMPLGNLKLLLPDSNGQKTVNIFPYPAGTWIEHSDII